MASFPTQSQVWGPHQCPPNQGPGRGPPYIALGSHGPQFMPQQWPVDSYHVPFMHSSQWAGPNLHYMQPSHQNQTVPLQNHTVPVGSTHDPVLRDMAVKAAQNGITVEAPVPAASVSSSLGMSQQTWNNPAGSPQAVMRGAPSEQCRQPPTLQTIDISPYGRVKKLIMITDPMAKTQENKDENKLPDKQITNCNVTDINSKSSPNSDKSGASDAATTVSSSQVSIQADHSEQGTAEIGSGNSTPERNGTKRGAGTAGKGLNPEVKAFTPNPVRAGGGTPTASPKGSAASRCDSASLNENNNGNTALKTDTTPDEMKLSVQQILHTAEEKGLSSVYEDAFHSKNFKDSNSQTEVQVRHKSAQTEGVESLLRSPLKEKRRTLRHDTEQVCGGCSGRDQKIRDLQREICVLRAQLCLNELHRQRFQHDLNLFWWKTNFTPAAGKSAGESILETTGSQVHLLDTRIADVNAQLQTCMATLDGGQELTELPTFCVTVLNDKVIVPVSTMKKKMAAKHPVPVTTADSSRRKKLRVEHSSASIRSSGSDSNLSDSGEVASQRKSTSVGHSSSTASSTQQSAGLALDKISPPVSSAQPPCEQFSSPAPSTLSRGECSGSKLVNDPLVCEKLLEEDSFGAGEANVNLPSKSLKLVTDISSLKNTSEAESVVSEKGVEARNTEPAERSDDGSAENSTERSRSPVGSLAFTGDDMAAEISESAETSHDPSAEKTTNVSGKSPVISLTFACPAKSISEIKSLVSEEDSEVAEFHSLSSTSSPERQQTPAADSTDQVVALAVNSVVSDKLNAEVSEKERIAPCSPTAPSTRSPELGQEEQVNPLSPTPPSTQLHGGCFEAERVMEVSLERSDEVQIANCHISTQPESDREQDDGMADGVVHSPTTRSGAYQSGNFPQGSVETSFSPDNSQDKSAALNAEDSGTSHLQHRGLTEASTTHSENLQDESDALNADDISTSQQRPTIAKCPGSDLLRQRKPQREVRMFTVDSSSEDDFSDAELDTKDVSTKLPTQLPTPPPTPDHSSTSIPDDLSQTVKILSQNCKTPAESRSLPESDEENESTEETEVIPIVPNAKQTLGDKTQTVSGATSGDKIETTQVESSLPSTKWASTEKTESSTELQTSTCFTGATEFDISSSTEKQEACAISGTDVHLKVDEQQTNSTDSSEKEGSEQNTNQSLTERERQSTGETGITTDENDTATDKEGGADTVTSNAAGGEESASRQEENSASGEGSSGMDWHLIFEQAKKTVQEACPVESEDPEWLEKAALEQTQLLVLELKAQGILLHSEPPGAAVSSQASKSPPPPPSSAVQAFSPSQAQTSAEVTEETEEKREGKRENGGENAWSDVGAVIGSREKNGKLGSREETGIPAPSVLSTPNFSSLLSREETGKIGSREVGKVGSREKTENGRREESGKLGSREGDAAMQAEGDAPTFGISECLAAETLAQKLKDVVKRLASLKEKFLSMDTSVAGWDLVATMIANMHEHVQLLKREIISFCERKSDFSEFLMAEYENTEEFLTGLSRNIEKGRQRTLLRMHGQTASNKFRVRSALQSADYSTSVTISVKPPLHASQMLRLESQGLVGVSKAQVSDMPIQTSSRSPSASQVHESHIVSLTSEGSPVASQVLVSTQKSKGSFPAKQAQGSHMSAQTNQGSLGALQVQGSRAPSQMSQGSSGASQAQGSQAVQNAFPASQVPLLTKTQSSGDAQQPFHTPAFFKQPPTTPWPPQVPQMLSSAQGTFPLLGLPVFSQATRPHSISRSGQIMPGTPNTGLTQPASSFPRNHFTVPAPPVLGLPQNQGNFPQNRFMGLASSAPGLYKNREGLLQNPFTGPTQPVSVLSQNCYTGPTLPVSVLPRNQGAFCQPVGSYSQFPSASPSVSLPCSFPGSSPLSTERGHFAGPAPNFTGPRSVPSSSIPASATAAVDPKGTSVQLSAKSFPSAAAWMSAVRTQFPTSASASAAPPPLKPLLPLSPRRGALQTSSAAGETLTTTSGVFTFSATPSSVSPTNTTTSTTLTKTAAAKSPEDRALKNMQKLGDVRRNMRQSSSSLKLQEPGAPSRKSMSPRVTDLPSPSGDGGGASAFQPVLNIKPATVSTNRFSALIRCDSSESEGKASPEKAASADRIQDPDSDPKAKRPHTPVNQTTLPRQAPRFEVPDFEEQPSKRASVEDWDSEVANNPQPNFSICSTDGDWQKVGNSRRRAHSDKQLNRQRRNSLRTPSPKTLPVGMSASVVGGSKKGSKGQMQRSASLEFEANSAQPSQPARTTPPPRLRVGEGSSSQAVEDWDEEINPFPTHYAINLAHPTHFHISSATATTAAPGSDTGNRSKYPPGFPAQKPPGFPTHKLPSFTAPKPGFTGQKPPGLTGQKASGSSLVVSSSSIPQLDQFSFSKKLSPPTSTSGRSHRPNVQFLTSLLQDNKTTNDNMKRSEKRCAGGDGRTHTPSPDAEKMENAKVETWQKVGKKGKTEPVKAKEQTKTAEAQGGKAPETKKTHYQMLVASLQANFPNLSKEDVDKVIIKVRSDFGGHLRGHKFNVITECAKKVVYRDFADALRSKPAPRPVFSEMNRTTTAPAVQKQKSPDGPWGRRSTSPGSEAGYDGGNGEECSVCLDIIRSGAGKQLECGHLFHAKCINKWVLEHERTCPNCRTHALMPEEFPRLGAN